MIDLRKCKAKFSSKQLRLGLKVEKEHTTSRKIATRIAKQHLCEDKRYYTKLRRVGL